MAGRKPVPVSVGTRLSTKKTLVLHPYDESTQFLRKAYERMERYQYDLISDFSSLTISDVRELMKKYDRILMLGHGTENGLVDRKRGIYVVDCTCVPVLKEKECIFVWCNANIFKEKYGLEGFATGMFISEIGEAFDCGKEMTLTEIDESNIMFAQVLSSALLEEGEGVRDWVYKAYRTNRGNRAIEANREFMFYD